MVMVMVILRIHLARLDRTGLERSRLRLRSGSRLLDSWRCGGLVLLLVDLVFVSNMMFSLIPNVVFSNSVV